jgi:protein ImuB
MTGIPISQPNRERQFHSRRILSIWLPQLAINRWETSAPPELAQQPVALITDSAHGPRIVAVNQLARAAGVAAALRLADARGLCPALQAVAHDASGDRVWIEALALWAQRWGPLTTLDGPDAVLVDITGVAHLFGGEDQICSAVDAALSRRGFVARTGIAMTPGAAWAMSHYAAAPGIITQDTDPLDGLGSLPVAALRLDPDVLLLLRRLGLKRIADLAGIHRQALVRRFRNRRASQTNPLIRLDQLLGRTPEPVLPVVAETMPLVQRRLVEPLLHLALLDQVLGDLTHDLVRLLEAQRLGARRVHMRCWRVDGDRIERRIELASATREPAHILRLFAPRLDDIDAGFGIDQVQLLCPWAEPLAMAQVDLNGDTVCGTSIHAFVDRIIARLGHDAITSPVAHASHMPERSQRWGPALAVTKSAQPILPLYGRPLKLLERPEPISVLYATPEGLPRNFRWRGKVHEIIRVEGPERIAPEWWREKSTARLRDYYRIEDKAGARYWIYRHGSLRDGRGGLPDWYLQGLFA